MFLTSILFDTKNLNLYHTAPNSINLFFTFLALLLKQASKSVRRSQIRVILIYIIPDFTTATICFDDHQVLIKNQCKMDSSLSHPYSNSMNYNLPLSRNIDFN